MEKERGRGICCRRCAARNCVFASNKPLTKLTMYLGNRQGNNRRRSPGGWYYGQDFGAHHKPHVEQAVQLARRHQTVARISPLAKLLHFWLRKATTFRTSSHRPVTLHRPPRSPNQLLSQSLLNYSRRRLRHIHTRI